MTPQQAKEWIEHSPASPGTIAPGLLGWRMAYDPPTVFCSHCVGRIMARGIGTQAMRNASPIWEDDGNTVCDCCETTITKPPK